MKKLHPWRLKASRGMSESQKTEAAVLKDIKLELQRAYIVIGNRGGKVLGKKQKRVGYMVGQVR